jgi:large subunit ribosomal protein L31
MKANIHPKFNKTAVVRCNTCKTEYVIGSTEDEIRVELCANCHPFYTGKQTLVDTDNLVDKYNKKLIIAKTSSKNLISKKEKRLERKKKNVTGQALTLKDMLMQVK